MRSLLTAAAAALLIVGPAHAGERPGGQGRGHHPIPAPCCAPPAPPPGPCCGHPGGGNTNVNVNVSARASASASASAYGSAHTWSGGAVRGGAGGGIIYSGGGYWGGDAYTVGLPVYGGIGYALDVRGQATPSRPFGYAVRGFGRDYRTVSTGSMSGDRAVEESRYGARYAPEFHRETYSAQSSYADSYYEESSYRADYEADISYGGDDDRREQPAYGCDCGPVGPRAYEPMPGPGYYGDLPPPGYESPVAPPPHHNYRQEPGERG